MEALRRIPLVLALAIALLLGGAVAYAAVPSTNGTFTGCVNDRTGVLRVIDPSKGQKCVERPPALRETGIIWNRRSPTGPVGPTTPGSTGLSSVDAFEGVPCDVKSSRPGVTRVRYWGGSGIQMFCQRPGDPDIPLTPPRAETTTADPPPSSATTRTTSPTTVPRTTSLTTTSRGTVTTSTSTPRTP